MFDMYSKQTLFPGIGEERQRKSASETSLEILWKEENNDDTKSGETQVQNNRDTEAY